jgi:glycosyltransferase involved in cell wall biosynthesis
MRILHLDAGRAMGGGQWQVLRLLEGLAAAGVESTLLARAGAPLYNAARKRGFRVEPLGILRTVRYARNHDLVHAHDARTHTLGAIVRSARLVVARRVAFPIGGGWKYRRALHYIAVSDFVRKVLIHGGVSPDRISVVYDGVPAIPDAPRGSEILALQKGATLAAEAARLAGVNLTIASDVERDLLRAGMLVYITHAEGLGSAVLLAMSAGVPVIASDIGGIPEVIQHGETGLLVPNQPEAIADAIRQLQSDPDLARRLAANARRALLDHFTVDHMVRQTLAIYRRLLM